MELLAWAQGVLRQVVQPDGPVIRCGCQASAIRRPLAALQEVRLGRAKRELRERAHGGRCAGCGPTSGPLPSASTSQQIRKASLPPRLTRSPSGPRKSCQAAPIARGSESSRRTFHPDMASSLAQRTETSSGIGKRISRPALGLPLQERRPPLSRAWPSPRALHSLIWDADVTGTHVPPRPTSLCCGKRLPSHRRTRRAGRQLDTALALDVFSGARCGRRQCAWLLPGDPRAVESPAAEGSLPGPFWCRRSAWLATGTFFGLPAGGVWCRSSLPFSGR